MVENPIKVVVASTYTMDADYIKKILQADPGVIVSGQANTLDELISMITSRQPDALLLDIESFSEDPVDAIRMVMAEAPVPIILLTSSNEKSEQVFEAISAGALTVVRKPDSVDGRRRGKAEQDLIRQTKLYSAIKVIKHLRGSQRTRIKIDTQAKVKDKIRIVVIASSTGGPQALRKVLSGLPENFPAGIIIAQHITQGFAKGLINWLNNECKIKVKQAEDAERIKPGTAYLAPDGYHIIVEIGTRVGLKEGRKSDNHLPSGNMLLASAAEVYGARAIGVILSGMGEDGVKGLLAIKQKGGKTIAQDEQSCVVFGMPKAALEKGAVKRTTPINRIAWEIMREFNDGRSDT
jgi:two-component system chemotaxis response regulator CheB